MFAQTAGRRDGEGSGHAAVTVADPGSGPESAAAASAPSATAAPGDAPQNPVAASLSSAIAATCAADTAGATPAEAGDGGESAAFLQSPSREQGDVGSASLPFCCCCNFCGRRRQGRREEVGGHMLLNWLNRRSIFLLRFKALSRRSTAVSFPRGRRRVQPFAAVLTGRLPYLTVFGRKCFSVSLVYQQGNGGRG